MNVEIWAQTIFENTLWVKIKRIYEDNLGSQHASLLSSF